VVVCSGCTDATAEIASTFAPRITVLELTSASKSNALNVAENTLHAGPRAFVDADVLIAGTSVSRLLDAVRDDSFPAAEPHVEFETSNSTFLVRAYDAVWVALHGVEPGDIGGGVYCLFESGTRRCGEFPNVISDVGYVRSYFATGEIKRLVGTSSTVRAPIDLGSLIKIETRTETAAGDTRQWRLRLLPAVPAKSVADGGERRCSRLNSLLQDSGGDAVIDAHRQGYRMPGGSPSRHRLDHHNTDPDPSAEIVE